MCILIDPNVISVIFNKSNEEHSEFKHVYDWVLYKNGKIVLGGSKFGKELAAMSRYLRLFTILEQLRKVVKLDNQLVDIEEERIQSLVTDKKLNDAHLVAIVSVSGCKVASTNDEGAILLLKNKTLYLNRRKPPFIYKSPRDRRHLADKNIVGSCLPNKPLSKEHRAKVESFLLTNRRQ